MNHEFPYLKKYTKRAFRDVFASILWNRDLSYGAKCFAFALLTVPPQSAVKLKRMAAKLNTYGSGLSRWRTELKKANVHIRDLSPLFSEK
jgi:hypothetical protein